MCGCVCVPVACLVSTPRYHESHDAKAQADAATRKEVAATKYFKTRSFDPVRIAFVDEQRELAFVQAQEQNQRVHGKDRVRQLPPREQFSEGRLYDIVNQHVLNAEQIGAATENEQRSLNRMQRTAFETKMHALGDELLATETALCLNRYAHARHTQSYVHGYDPISNASFSGRSAQPMLPTRTHAALSAWQVLETGVQTSAKVALSPSLHARPSESVGTTLSTNSSDRRSLNTPPRSNVLVLGAGNDSISTSTSGSSANGPPGVRTSGFASH